MKKPVVSGPWSVAFDADAFGFNCHRRGMGASVDGEKGRMIRRKGRVELPDGVGGNGNQGYSRLFKVPEEPHQPHDAAPTELGFGFHRFATNMSRLRRWDAHDLMARHRVVEMFARKK